VDVIDRKILAAREETITAAGHTFTVRRLAGLPLKVLQSRTRGDTTQFLIDLVRESVVDWDMDEASLFPGGGDARVPFKTSTFMLWVEDNDDAWTAIVEAVLDMMARHNSRREAAEKN
jgi:hypothetical protein